MPIQDIKAIDVHAHVGSYTDDKFLLTNEFMSGNADIVHMRAQMANTQLSIVSPLKAFLPRYKGDPITANEEIARVMKQFESLYYWAVIDPTKPKTYAQAAAMLKQAKCLGIKIHPEEHGYLITEYGRKIFEFVAEQNAAILTHSGEKNSLPGDFVKFANDFQTVKVILAHLGCGWDDDPTHQVKAIQKSKYGNMFVDTSSAKSIMPGIIEWAVREVGADRILYGSDSPLYFAPMQRARIDFANIKESEKQQILRDNAIILFGLEDVLNLHMKGKGNECRY